MAAPERSRRDRACEHGGANSEARTAAPCQRRIVPFAKLHGLGNDFVIIDDLAGRLELAPGQVARICDRHRGVGADGLIVARPSARPGCAAYMRFYNADGSVAQMCGNGIRCFAKFLLDRGLAAAPGGRLALETPVGPRELSVELDAAGRMVRATVDMGAPELSLERVPLDTARAQRVVAVGVAAAGASGVAVAAQGSVVELDSPWGPFAFMCVSMGNPHAVCLVEDWAALPGELFATGAVPGLGSLKVSEVGSFFEVHPAFPERVNVEFVDVACAPGVLSVRVHERGVGETLACGTGACAVAVAGVLLGCAGAAVDVRLPGGTLQVAWGGGAGDHVFMTGPAEESFTGVLAL